MIYKDDKLTIIIFIKFQKYYHKKYMIINCKKYIL